MLFVVGRNKEKQSLVVAHSLRVEDGGLIFKGTKPRVHPLVSEGSMQKCIKLSTSGSCSWAGSKGRVRQPQNVRLKAIFLDLVDRGAART